LTQDCPPCLYEYNDWSACINGKQTRTVKSKKPPECGGTPITEADCTPEPETATYSGALDAAGTFTITLPCSYCDNGDYVCTYIVTASGTITATVTIQSNGTYSGSATLSGQISAPAGVSDCTA
jgi:hypothetical protein